MGVASCYMVLFPATHDYPKVNGVCSLGLGQVASIERVVLFRLNRKVYCSV